MDQHEFSTVELGEVRVTLRDDLHFALQHYGGVPCYVIEDAGNSRFYRIGIPEYTFISLLDGQTTIREALHHTASVLEQDAFTEQDAATICKWLIDCQLADTDASGSVARLVDQSQTASQHRHRQWLNPIVLKIPLLNPEPYLRHLSKGLGWLTGPVFFYLWLAVILSAVHQLFTHGDRFAVASSGVLDRSNWLWLAVSWLALKLIHESFHGLVCKKYGGHVREAGIVLIVFAPICYVDVTSSWRFPTKWQRIFTSAAGMYAELFVGAIAVHVWCRTEVGPVNHLALNVMLLSTLTTLLFNANPLMRFDGYYILADLLEIPNLYVLGQQYLGYLSRRYLLGIEATHPRWPAAKAVIIKVYAVSSFLWRWFVCICLLIAAQALFQGAGVVIALMALVLWLGLPAYRFARYLILGNQREKPDLWRFTMVAGTGSAALLMLVLVIAPSPLPVRAPGLVTYAPLTVVRAQSPGFVRQLRVSPGERVSAGQVLAVLANAELATEAARLALTIEHSLVRSRVFQENGEIAALQVENQRRESLETKFQERQQQCATWWFAPVGGQVIASDLMSLMGTYVEEGTELLAIGDELKKEVVLSVAQEDFEIFASQKGKPVDVRVPSAGRTRLQCRLGAVDPRASTRLTEPSLSAAAGGPLPVRPKHTEDAHPSNERETWELVEPRLTATVQLSPEQGQQLRAGQLARATLRVARGPLGSSIYRRVGKWIRRRIERASAVSSS